MSEMDYSKMRKPREPWYVDFICLDTEKKDYPLHKWYAEQQAAKKKKKFKCPECRTKFDNFDDYLHHILSKHNAHPCPLCSGLCKRLLNSSTCVCNSCNTSFRKKSNSRHQGIIISERSKKPSNSNKRSGRPNKKAMQRNTKYDDSTLKNIEESIRQNESNKNRFYTQLALASLAASDQNDDE